MTTRSSRWPTPGSWPRCCRTPGCASTRTGTSACSPGPVSSSPSSATSCSRPNLAAGRKLNTRLITPQTPEARPPRFPGTRRRLRGDRCSVFAEGPQFHRAAAGERVPGRDLDRLVEILAVEHVVADHQLLGLGERAVGDEELPAANPDGGGVSRLQRPAL